MPSSSWSSRSRWMPQKSLCVMAWTRSATPASSVLTSGTLGEGLTHQGEVGEIAGKTLDLLRELIDRLGDALRHAVKARATTAISSLPETEDVLTHLRRRSWPRRRGSAAQRSCHLMGEEQGSPRALPPERAPAPADAFGSIGADRRKGANGRRPRQSQHGHLVIRSAAEVIRAVAESALSPCAES